MNELDFMALTTQSSHLNRQLKHTQGSVLPSKCDFSLFSNCTYKAMLHLAINQFLRLTGNRSSIMPLSTLILAGAMGFSSRKTGLCSSGNVPMYESSRIRNIAVKYKAKLGIVQNPTADFATSKQTAQTYVKQLQTMLKLIWRILYCAYCITIYERNTFHPEPC